MQDCMQGSAEVDRELLVDGMGKKQKKPLAENWNKLPPSHPDTLNREGTDDIESSAIQIAKTRITG